MNRAMRQSVSTVLYPDTGSLRRGTVDNAGLELSRYLRKHPGPQRRVEAQREGKIDAHEELLTRIDGAGIPDGYEAACDRWKSALQALPGSVAQARFRVAGRLIVGMGAESVLENTVTVNRLWGMPLIPGSALKGLTSHYLAGELSAGDPDLRRAVLPEGADAKTQLPLNSHGILFGTGDNAAYVTWHDAWFIPSRSNIRPFHRDVLTNHHQTYYTKRGTDPARPPWDFDDPNPVPFLSTAGVFLIVVQGPDQQWANFGLDLLSQALEHAGVGAKTSSGYGRMERIGSAAPAESQQPSAGIEELLQEIDQTEQGDINLSVHKWYMRWKEIADPAQSRSVARHIVQKLQTAPPKVVKRISSRSWGKELIAAAEDPDAAEDQPE